MNVSEITPLQIALARQSVQGVILAYLDERGAEETTLAQVIEFLGEHGLPNDKEKVYASLQSLATNGKIDRGVNKGTYAAKDTVDQEARAAAKALRSENAKRPVTERKRREPKESKTYSNEEVFTHLIEKLGDPVDWDGVTNGPNFTLLGDSSPEYILERARLSLGNDPTSWAILQFGPNTAVLFPDA